MVSVARRTLPEPFVKRHFRHLMPAAVAAFRTGVPLIQFYQMASCLCGLVLQFRDKSSPASVPDGTRQSAIFHHVCRFQRLDNYRLVFVYNCAR
nr:hypothetical protein 495p1_00027 [Serratia proteamaculans]